MSPETSRGFTYRWRVGEREQGVTQALVEQELSSSSEDEEEVKSEVPLAQHMGVTVVEQAVTVLPYASSTEHEVGRRSGRQAQDPVAHAL